MEVIITPEDPDLPFKQIEKASEEIGGKISHLTCLDSSGRSCKKIVIEYDDQDNT